MYGGNPRAWSFGSNPSTFSFLSSICPKRKKPVRCVRTGFFPCLYFFLKEKVPKRTLTSLFSAVGIPHFHTVTAPHSYRLPLQALVRDQLIYGEPGPGWTSSRPAAAQNRKAPDRSLPASLISDGSLPQSDPLWPGRLPGTRPAARSGWGWP